MVSLAIWLIAAVVVAYLIFLGLCVVLLIASEIYEWWGNRPQPTAEEQVSKNLRNVALIVIGLIMFIVISLLQR